MGANDAVVNIPMTETKSRWNADREQGVHITTAELKQPVRPLGRPNMGRRQTASDDRKMSVPEEDEMTRLGHIYDQVINISPMVRWAVYILPVASLLAIPIVLCDTVYYHANAAGIKFLGLFLWIEVVWMCLWMAKLCAILMPIVFQSTFGLASSGMRKYAYLLRTLEVPISIFLWAILSFSTNRLIYIFNQHIPHLHQIPWLLTLTRVLRANIATSAILLAEKTLIQLIGVHYNRKQFESRIQENKMVGHIFDLMYDASTRKHPAYTRPDFVELDIDIHQNTESTGARTRRFLNSLGRLGDGVTEAFGNMASEITGKQVFKPTATHHIVNQALERRVGSLALAERLWRSLIAPGAEALYEQDLIEELGSQGEAEARYIFAALDKDQNGDVSLGEMKMLAEEVYLSRVNMYKGYQDVKEALRILDSVMSIVVLIIVCLVYATFFSDYLAQNFYSLWTVFTGCSFLFGATAGELFGACILVFVKHPYDIGDRVTINNTELVVQKISLLYTLFKRVENNGLVQIPNSVNNGNWIDNLSRSKAMKERLTFSVNAGTTFADIETLRAELEAFVTYPENKRDYQPEVDIELISAGDLSKLDLRVELQHKSNWSNEPLRAYRRSKFMCALVSAMRKVPIESTGGSGAPPGTASNPNYSVNITEQDVEASKAKFNADQDAKRLHPKMSSTEATDSTIAISSGLELLPALLGRQTPVAT